MATSFLVAKNRAFSKLAAAVNDSTTTFTVTAGQGAKFPSTYPFHSTVEDEIVSVTNRSTDTLTVVRAQQSTSAASHPLKAYIALHITAKSITDLNTAVNTLEAYDVITTKGDIIYGDATPAPERLAIGTDNYIMAVATDVPAWKSPATILGDLTGANLDVGAFDVRGQTLTADGLTSGRVVIAGASGVLSDDSDLTFSGDTLTATKIAATTFTGFVTIDLSAAVASHLLLNGTAKINSGEQAIYVNFPSETAAVNGVWVTLGSTVTSGDLTGIRSRVTGNAASSGANVRGAYLEGKVGANLYAAQLEGALIHADYSAGGATISGDVRGLTVHISQGSGLNAANLYGILLSMQTRGGETISSDDIGLLIRNEAVGGSGRTMGAAIKIAELNMGAGVNGFTDDIVFHKTSHIRDEVGYLTIYGTAGYVRIGDAGTTAHSLAAEDDLMVTGKFEVKGVAFFDADVTFANPLAMSAMAAGVAVAVIPFIIDGGGSAITTGQKGHVRIPFACTINRATALADQSGSIVVDIWKDTYGNFPPADGDSITASAPVTISGATKSEDSTLTGWTTSISADDILAFNVDSVTDIERVLISLKVTKT